MLQMAREKRWVLIVGGSIVLVLLGAILFRSPRYVETEPELIRIEKLERSKDVPALCQAVHDPNPRVVGRALAGLSRVGGPSAEPAFREALGDSRPQVRQSAALAIGEGGRHELVGAVIETLKSDKSVIVRVAAAKALGQLRDWDGVEPLLAALDDPDRYVRQAAGRSVEQILGIRFSYNPDDSKAHRLQVIAQIRDKLPAAHAQYDKFMKRTQKERPS